MRKIRTLVGVGAFPWMSYAYKLAPKLSDAADEQVDKSWTSALVLAATSPLSSASCTAWPRRRRDGTCCAGRGGASARSWP
ncbi:hypothetical protein [Streptomyces caeruleatus]|uniref:Uncharacterized protein n=1 Tax=Streptomyces caeruleatus TaxID=661399 RepID=A0A101TDF3_9ACTN|nr:hypothetical protein [Streptomyces caeruleatus]KUN90425.1 hypothetical protein AQJ67_44100 [Streptomyces caeruleatus]